MTQRASGTFTGVAVVTGGGGGIGRAAVERWLADGWAVVAADLNADRGAVLIDDLDAGDRLRFLAVDVSREDDMAHLIDTAVDTFGQLDALFNNAGIGGAFGPITEQTVEDWDATFAVNLRSVFLGTKHAARVMIAGGQPGAIVNTASVAALTGGGGPQAYSATKAGVVSLTQSTAVELAPHHIRVNAVCPGAIYTDLLHRGNPDHTDSWRRDIQPWPERGDAAAIADIAVWLASDEARFVTGTSIVADGGLMAATPRLMDHDLAHMKSMSGIAWGNTGRPAEVRRLQPPPPQ